MAQASQQTTIYVGDLPVHKTKDGNASETAVTEEFLRSLFSEVGNVVPGSAGVTLKQKEGRDGNIFAFAFINFETREDAERAISELNYTKLDNVPIRLSLADKETNRIRKSGQGNLFIKNLDPAIEVSQLHEAFANFGEIISCKIPQDNGVSRGYGYVQFRNPEDANQAMHDLKDASINNRPVQIEPYMRRQRQNPAETYTNVYIKDLPDTIKSDEDIKNLFAQYGDVQSPKLVTDENGKSRNFGYCNMRTHEDAENAVNGLNGKEIDGVTVHCNRAMTRRERQSHLKAESERWRKLNHEKYKGRNLYVRNFDESITDEDLKAVFSPYGEIESVKVMRDPETEISKKFGFVCFVSEQDADRCIKESTLIQIKDKQCYVAKAMSKDERIKQNLNRTNQQRPNPNAANAQHQMPGAAMPMSAPFYNGIVQGIGMGQPPMGAMMPNPMLGGIPQMNQMGSFGIPDAMHTLPAMGAPGFPMNPMAGNVPFAQTQPDPKSLLRAEMMDRKPGNAVLLQRIRDMSEEQANTLINDQSLLDKWIETA